MVIVLIFAFLPYLKTSPLGSDVQPHFLAAFSIWLLLTAFRTRRLPLYPATLTLAIYSLFAIFFLNGPTQAVSVFILIVATDVFSRMPAEIFIRTAKISCMVLLLGVLLNVFAEALLSGFVSNYRDNVLRGLNSFASEPSYFGIIGFVLTTVLLYFRSSVIWVSFAVCLSLFSGSLTAIAPLAVLLFLRFTKGKALILLPAFLFAAWFGVLQVSETETRIGNLLFSLLNSPEVLFLDVSFSNRFLRAVGPLVSAYNSGFIPHDFSKPIELYYDFLAVGADEAVERLSSLATVLIYGIGFLSAPVFVAYFFKAKAPVFLWFAVFYLLTTNISVATPYIAVILALPLLHKREVAMQRTGQPHMAHAVAKSLRT